MSNHITLPLSGLEEPLSEMEQAVQDTAHRFAEEVLRPAGTQIDQMSADDSVAPESPLWSALQQATGLGLSVKAMLELPPLERERVLLIAAEELSWGDAGLGGMVLVSQMPREFRYVQAATIDEAERQGRRPGALMIVDEAGVVYSLPEGEFTVGRSNKNDVVVDERCSGLLERRLHPGLVVSGRHRRSLASLERQHLSVLTCRLLQPQLSAV